MSKHDELSIDELDEVSGGNFASFLGQVITMVKSFKDIGGMAQTVAIANGIKVVEGTKIPTPQ